MNRTAALIAAFALVVAGVAVPAAGSIPGAESAPAQLDAANESAEPAAPGARLAGVVAVQATEVRSEVDGRTFGIRIARSPSNGSKADLVAEEVAALERRLATIRERQRALERARENGTVSRARYAAEAATLAARSAAVDQQLARTASASRSLPEDVLAARGVNASAIDALRSEARNLTGPEVAAVARTIAGPDAGRGLGPTSNASAGPPQDRPAPADGGPPATPDAEDDRGPPANASRPDDVPRGGGR